MLGDQAGVRQIVECGEQQSLCKVAAGAKNHHGARPGRLRLMPLRCLHDLGARSGCGGVCHGVRDATAMARGRAAARDVDATASVWCFRHGLATPFRADPDRLCRAAELQDYGSFRRAVVAIGLRSVTDRHDVLCKVTRSRRPWPDRIKPSVPDHGAAVRHGRDQLPRPQQSLDRRAQHLPASSASRRSSSVWCSRHSAGPTRRCRFRAAGWSIACIRACSTRDDLVVVARHAQSWPVDRPRHADHPAHGGRACSRCRAS